MNTTCTCLMACSVAVWALAGCASTEQLADQGVQANEAQEQMTNRMLLLNVVRAYHRRPMHFTRVVTGRFSAGHGLTTSVFGLPFGGDATNSYSVTPTLAVNRPSIDVSPLDSQEFMQGLTTKVPTSALLYFIEQGWPRELVLHLFIERIDVHMQSPEVEVKTTRFHNAPDDAEKFGAFHGFIRGIADCDFSVGAVPPANYGGPVPLLSSDAVAGLAAAKSAGLSASAVPLPGAPLGGVQLQLPPAVALKLTHPPGRLCSQPPQATRPAPAAPANPLTTDTLAEALRALKDSISAAQTLMAPQAESGEPKRPISPCPDKTTCTQTDIVMRSPEGVLRYLGQLGRAQGGVQALFKLNRGAEAPGRSAVKVEYDGSVYWVADHTTDASDRSTEALALTNQVLQLLNKGTAMPGSATVRLLPP